MTSHTLTSPDGKINVEWDCGFNNPASNSVKIRIFAALTGLDDPAVCLLYASIIANTRNIIFTYKDGTPPDQIASLEKYWLWCIKNLFIREDGETVSIVDDEKAIQQSYKKFQRWVSSDLQVIWAEGYNKAQVMFPADDVYKHDNLLDPERLKDAAFLARGGQR